ERKMPRSWIGGAGSASGRGRRAIRHRRRKLDHGCALSRNRRGDRGRAREGYSRRRNGGGRALCLCPNARVLCFAHVTNTMGQSGADFEKGEAEGTADVLALLSAVVKAAKRDLVARPA